MNEPICNHCGGGPASEQHQQECEEDTVLYQQQARIAELGAALAASRVLVAALKEAGVTDYSTLTGSHRVDCHFCNGVWTSGQPPKHHKGCPLTFTEADMLARLEEK